MTTFPSPTPNAGDQVLIRTVTHYHVGRITAITQQWITLEDASWVASTGRFGEALETGNLDEVERFLDPVWIALGAVVDVTFWRHDLPVPSR